MENQIKVSMINSRSKGVVSFNVEIPEDLIINGNFMDVMQSYELSNSVGWLRALANLIESIQKRSGNG